MSRELTSFVAMSFSPIPRAAMDNREVYYRPRFFKHVMRVWACRRPREQQQWIIALTDALNQHLPDADLVYLISTKSLSHFIKSLEVLIDYGDVHILCIERCNAHVRHQCACNTDVVACLAPHKGQTTHLL